MKIARVPLLLCCAFFAWVQAQRPFGGACPAGCECFADTRGPPGLGCRVEVRCTEKQVSFPTGYDDATDCVSIENPMLSRLDMDEKRAMFAAMPAGLRLLDLSLCGLGANGGLPSATFGRFTQLRFLNLEFNRLEALPADAFHGTAALRTLWLTGNHWQPHEEGYKLRELLGNRLRTVHAVQFEGMAQLQVLLMHHNQLGALPAALFEGMQSLRVLKLLDNPGLGDDGAVTASPALRPLVAEGQVGRCPRNQPSAGQCLQLDVEEDSGDALEDVWDENGVGLAPEAELQKFMRRFHARMQAGGGAGAAPAASGAGGGREEEEEEDSFGGRDEEEL
eukprot:g1287.t1